VTLGPYPVGTQVQVEAIPDPGLQFLYWTNSITSTNNPLQITMDRNHSIQAVFGGSLTLEVNGEGTYFKDPDKPI